jgi:hypothetical protein
MRGIFCGVMMALMATVAQAQKARNDAASLYEDCNVLASAHEDLSNIRGLEMTKAMFCVGYLHAIHDALIRVHDHYKSIFPNYGHWNDDQTFLNGWLSAQILLAPDVCFPKEIRPKTLAMIIAKFGKEHPEKLTMDMFLFASLAFQSSYPPTGCDR